MSARAPAAIVALLAGLLAVGLVPRGVSNASYLDSAAVGSNAFQAGQWYFYLHNRPTPPIANTAAQANLGMDTTAPTAATLYNYDTNVDAQPGRRLRRAGSGPGESNLQRYANWQTGAFTGARTIAGNVRVDLWCAVVNFTLAQTGSIAAYLRDYDPGTGTYTEIANATLTQANWQAGSGTWVFRQISIPSVSYTMPAGHQLELKLITTTSAWSHMWVAYDTTAYPSALLVP